VDPDVRKLLIEKIDSFEKLEVLALLCAERTLAFTQRTASARLRLSESLVQTALLDLCAAGILDKQGEEYRYQPLTNGLSKQVEGLCTAYNEDRIAVLNVLTKGALERIRGSAANAFADAFRLRGKKGDD
jgi:hypothetical protein